MIVAELTLVALAYGINQARDHNDAIAVLSHAREARAARLHELRDAAAQVAMIGEYYHPVRARTWPGRCFLCAPRSPALPTHAMDQMVNADV
jgi:hypothetical protein